MRYLLNKPIDELLGIYQRYFIFLDLDGTLSPIARKPDLAVLPGSTKNIIKELAKNDKVRLAIISGRKLTDIKRIVGINKIIYAGNHGMEIRGKGVKRNTKLPKSFAAAKRKILAEIRSKTKLITGVLIEDKGYTAAIHYRLTAYKDRIKIKRIFYQAAAALLRKGRIKVKEGKMLYELHPHTEWNKGKAIKWLLSIMPKKRILPIYIGDDITDADAFIALRNKGITVFVGSKAQYGAKYYLKNTNDVGEFLSMIVKKVGK